MAVRREKAAAELPEPRPDLFTVGLRNFQAGQRRAREKSEYSLGMGRRQRFQLRLHFKQKHQPVCPALVTVLADDAGQMEVRGVNFNAEFLRRFATGASVGRFANVHFQFATARAPETAVRFLRAFEQEHVVALVEAIKQRRNFMRQCHSQNFKFRMANVECKIPLSTCSKMLA